MKANERSININSPSFPTLPLIPQAPPGPLRLPRLSRLPAILPGFPPGLPLAQYRNRQLADEHRQQKNYFEEN